jgi:hypothetical protein
MNRFLQYAARFGQFVDNRINPIVVKELRQAVQARYIIVGLQLFLLVLVSVTCLMILVAINSRQGQDLSEIREMGTALFATLAIILYISSALLIVPYTGIRLAAEQLRGDLMFITTLKARSVVTGKFLSGVLVTLLLYSAALPFLTLAYLLRGIDIPTILYIFFLTFLLVQTFNAGALVLASFRVKLPAMLMLGLLGFIGLINAGVASIQMAFFSFLWGFGMGGSMIPELEGIVIMFSVFLLVIGTMLVLANVNLAPPSSNRMLPLRIFMTIVLTLSFFLFWWGGTAAGGGPSDAIIAWFFLFTPLWILMMLIAVCERESWGTRISRTIPLNPLLRLLVFPFYTGAPNGIFWCILAFLGMMAVLIFHSLEYGNSQDVPATLAFFLLFVFAYCTTAMLLRNTLFRRVMKKSQVAILAFLMVALFSAGGMLLDFAVNPQGYQDYQHSPILAPNLFLLFGGGAEEAPIQVATSLLWSIMAGLFTLSWFVPKLKRFSPLYHSEAITFEEAKEIATGAFASIGSPFASEGNAGEEIAEAFLVGGVEESPREDLGPVDGGPPPLPNPLGERNAWGRAAPLARMFRGIRR